MKTKNMNIFNAITQIIPVWPQVWLSLWFFKVISWKPHIVLTLNVRGPSYLGLARSISGCWCPGSLRRQDISSHDIDYIEYVGPYLTWGRILSTCVISMWRNDIKYMYMFMVTLKNLAHNGLMRDHGNNEQSSALLGLTRCDLVSRYSNIDLGQYWLQFIAWTYADTPSVRSCAINPGPLLSKFEDTNE